MAMGTRQDEQTPLWIATSELPTGPGHPFYSRLNADGSQLEYSTYMGGSASDHAYDVATDAEGNAFVAGPTASA